jgi:hypothetical protein
MIEKIKNVDWGAYSQPYWNKADSVANALRSVIYAYDEASSMASYGELLSATGNNHGGSYFPVLLPVIPFLEEILRVGNPWSANAVLNALCDLFASFYPEPGYEEVEVAPGQKVQVEAVFKEKVLGLRSLVEHHAHNNQFGSACAKELLSILDEFRAQ